MARLIHAGRQGVRRVTSVILWASFYERHFPSFNLDLPFRCLSAPVTVRTRHMCLTGPQKYHRVRSLRQTQSRRGKE